MRIGTILTDHRPLLECLVIPVNYGLASGLFETARDLKHSIKPTMMTERVIRHRL